MSEIDFDSMTDDAKLAMALEALELAKGIMNCCKGDTWERECTEKDREAFQAIYDRFNPPAPVVEERGWMHIPEAKIPCLECGRMCRGTRGLWDHSKQFHGNRQSHDAFRKAYKAEVARRNAEVEGVTS